MDDVSRLEIAAGGYDGIADGAAADATTLFVNSRPTLGVDGTICAVTFIEPPVGGGDNRVGVLVGNVPCYKTQFCFADGRLHEQAGGSRLSR
jgi:hypothetical protein